MTDQQFQDLVFRLETSLSSLGAKQDIATQQLSQQLGDIANSVSQVADGSAVSSNAAIFVDTLNKNFNFAAVRGPEKPDQIGQNQVYIAGITPAAASVLSGSGGPTGGRASKNEIEDIISSLPIVGPVFSTLQSIVGFLMSPVNLVTLGGMALAFMGLKKFFAQPANAKFFGGGGKDFYTFLTETIGKIVSFFTTEEVTGDHVKAKIETIWDSIIGSITGFFTKEGGIWKSQSRC